MARPARVVAPGVPHHITQRGNRRQETFFCDEDYDAYIELMAEWCEREGVEVWTYCLMPNHVHLIAVPEKIDAMFMTWIIFKTVELKEEAERVEGCKEKDGRIAQESANGRASVRMRQHNFSHR